jgi:hypothetical protein
MRFLVLAFAALLLLPAAAGAGQAPTFRDRPSVGQPVRYTDAAGNVFQPRSLIVLTAKGAFATPIPAATNSAYYEDRLDLSGIPLIGHLFAPRLAPSDAARDGLPLGPVRRFGETLVLDARNQLLPPGPLSLVLTANFPREGAVSFNLGPVDFALVVAPEGAGQGAGAAYLVGHDA